LQAAILRIKLRHLDAYGPLARPLQLLRPGLCGIMEHDMCPERSPNSTHVFHQYTLR
jgi:UDP-2-acetamido-2-deoxy-ribo-hexuluronate aminotransferase